MIRTQTIERDIETLTEAKLRELGWVDDIYSSQQTIWKQQPKTQEQKKKLGRKKPDYILYQTETDNPLIVLETKRPKESLSQALEQAIKYAQLLKAPLAIATTGEFVKCFHVNFRQTLTRDEEEEVNKLFSEEEALKFIEKSHLITKDDKVILSRQELIKVFAEANDLLWKIGLQKGDERFSEFANILFLKIISEKEEPVSTDKRI